MSQKLSYRELLLDPRWQKKRLEVLEAANWTCASCHSTDKTLHVHHGYYRKGALPWEYPTSALHCLCVDCHGKMENDRAALMEAIGVLSAWWDIRVLTGYAKATAAINGEGPARLHFELHNMWVELWGVADALHVSVSVVMKAVDKEGWLDLSTFDEVREYREYATWQATHAEQEGPP